MKNTKYKLILGILLISTSILAQNSATPGNLTSKIILSLQPGEKILTAESCLVLSVSNNQSYVVVSKNNQLFVYDNGQRKGPYKDVDEANIKPCDSNNQDNNSCSVYEPAGSVNNTDYLVMNDDGTYAIKLNGKTYGPYPFIKDLQVWPDKSGFVAIIMDKQMKSTLVSSDGTNLALNGETERLQVSPTGKKYVVALKETPGIDPAFLNTDFSKLSQDEIMKLAQKQADREKNAGPPKSYIYTTGGTKLGPFDTQTFYSNNPAFTRSGGDNWIMVVDNTLYINGKIIKKYEDTDLNTCRIWLSRDGKRYAIISYDKVIFSDGNSYSYPLVPSSYEKDGKIFIKWLSLEHEKDLVLYSKEL
jgi:hypothetical protein